MPCSLQQIIQNSNGWTTYKLIPEVWNNLSVDLRQPLSWSTDWVIVCKIFFKVSTLLLFKSTLIIRACHSFFAVRFFDHRYPNLLLSLIPSDCHLESLVTFFSPTTIWCHVITVDMKISTMQHSGEMTECRSISSARIFFTISGGGNCPPPALLRHWASPFYL